MSRIINRDEFNAACEALWSEIEYQNNLPRRTNDEAKDTPGFLTLGERYIRKTADTWVDEAGDAAGPHGMRKLAAIFLRGMIYLGIVGR